MSDQQEKLIDEEFLSSVREHLLSMYKKDGRLPSIRFVAAHFGVSEYRMNEVFRLLVHGGFLRRNYSRYKMSENTTPVDPVLEEAVEALVEEGSPDSIPQTETPRGSVDPREGWSVSVIRIVLGFVGLGAIGMSVYYTSIWFFEYLPPSLAILLSTIMVTFSTMAFEVVLHLVEMRRRILAAGFLILFVMVLLFSMMSTVAGQYNKQVEVRRELIEETSQGAYSKVAYEALLDQERRIEDQIRNQDSLRSVHQKLFESYDAIGKVIDPEGFADAQEQLNKIDNTIAQLLQQLSVKQSERTTFLSKAGVVGVTPDSSIEAPSFYVWVASLVGREDRVDLVQFWISVFPAVFIDLIAPFSLAFALFKQKRRK